MGKCMSKDQLQDKLIQHISSPVRTDDGVGFALGRLSSSHQSRWVKYEDIIPSEEVKPVVSEGQAVMARSGSRSYALTYPQGHLVSCAAFVSGGPLGDSECTCGQRRPSESTVVQASANSPAQKKRSPVAKATNESNTNRKTPENDVENVGARPLKPLFNTPAKQNREALRETNVNVNVLLDVPGTKPGKLMKESHENVDIEHMLLPRESPRKPVRLSLTEREFQALDSPPALKSPVKQQPAPTVDCNDEVLKSPVLVETSSSPKRVSTPSLGSSLQSILSAISDPDASSLVEEVLSKASAAQSRCTDLEKVFPAESKSSHTPFSDESDTESSLGEIDPDTPSSKSVSRQSFDQSEDDGPGQTPVTARSVRTRLPIDGEFCKDDKPIHWRASALYTNCLFEESPAKNIVKSAERRFSGGGTKFTIGHDAATDQEHGSGISFSATAAAEPAREVPQPDSSIDLGIELKRKSVDETLPSGASTSPFKKVKSFTEKTICGDLLVPAPDSTCDDDPSSSATKEVVIPAKDSTVKSDSEIAPDVKAFLQTSKKVVLSLTPDGTGDCENSAKKQPSVTDSLTSSGFKEIFSSSSLAAVLELEALLVTSDVRRMSGHGVEGLQIVGSELTELFSSNVRVSTGESSKTEGGHSSRVEVKLGDLSISPYSPLPKSEASLAVSSPCSFVSGREGSKVVAHSREEVSGNGADSSSSEDPCMSETCDLKSDELETPPFGKDGPQATEDAVDNQRKEGYSTRGYPNSKSPVPLSFPTTTSERRTAVSCTPQLLDHSNNTVLSLEDFQFLLDAAEGEDEKKANRGGSAETRSGNMLASFGRSILQKLRDSLPNTPSSSLPSTPIMSASSTPLISKASTPQRTGPHANSVALSPEEIAEIWGAFEKIHLR
ncbi:hypothetical protein R1flu_014488 [Riccia fluitans]|uniref:Uncharacterized protein n=1 Tax=Riccia fluitans TaxID=41844 RepID=A0ABD1YJD3_9MARC